VLRPSKKREELTKHIERFCLQHDIQISVWCLGKEELSTTLEMVSVTRGLPNLLLWRGAGATETEGVLLDRTARQAKARLTPGTN
jgi:hypothetical protein